MRVDFYHLTRSGPEGILPALASRLLSAGERLLVVAQEQAVLEKLDGALWTYKPESFLPHVIAGNEDNDDSAEPILLAASCEPVNGAENVAIADGLWRDEALGFSRVFYLFDTATIPAARAAWKTLGTHEDLERHYWKQDNQGRWAEGP